MASFAAHGAMAGTYNFNIVGPELGPSATGINPGYVLQAGDTGTLTNYLACVGVCSNPDPGNIFTTNPGGPGAAGNVTGYLTAYSQISFSVAYNNPSFDPTNIFMLNQMFLGSQSASGTIYTDIAGNIHVSDQVLPAVSVQSTDGLDQNGNPLLSTVLTAINDTAAANVPFEVYFRGTSDSGLINPTMTFWVSAIAAPAPVPAPEPTAGSLFGVAVIGLMALLLNRNSRTAGV